MKSLTSLKSILQINVALLQKAGTLFSFMFNVIVQYYQSIKIWYLKTKKILLLLFNSKHANIAMEILFNLPKFSIQVKMAKTEVMNMWSTRKLNQPSIFQNIKSKQLDLDVFSILFNATPTFTPFELQLEQRDDSLKAMYLNKLMLERYCV